MLKLFIADEEQLTSSHPIYGLHFDEIKQLIDRLARTIEQVNRTKQQHLSITVNIGISGSLESTRDMRTPKRKVQQALELIQTSYADHGMTLSKVAKALFVSSSYLSTLFKQELGVNFLDYVHQYRIGKAKALLQASDLKIHSVAKEVGYYDEAHFTKTFKKWTGILPSQYKKTIG
ncbi:helix-turn-helix domain-containing protein [Paenibacillus glycanilyticus]|uniref:HTH araC/xylS-type domain-containing protein n=1 Tax=Paenibacillus glycanilyticus TaxID=126569 RepID=A0ABQ6G690_9BACL|nr:helix-turn-helix domain-containing protein [Paenibacillus glycanilyticus]GLX66469.1 hypothetical protein MU1_08130 [Paenibacillus glycanilyticus]